MDAADEYRLVETVYNGVVYAVSDFPLRIVVQGKLIPRTLVSLQHVQELADYVAEGINADVTYPLFARATGPAKTASGKKGANSGNVIAVEFASGRHGRVHGHDPFDGAGNVQAHASLPPYKFICFDGDDAWDDYKFKNMLIHELGHILGLLDLYQYNNSSLLSIMNNPAHTKGRLSRFDIRNLRRLYKFLR